MVLPIIDLPDAPAGNPALTTNPLRVLCLFKRRYMRKDVISDRYARLYELPRELARRGHEVLVICLNYRGPGRPFDELDPGGNGRLRWQSWNLGRLVVPGFLRYRRNVTAAIRQFAPDVLLGGSDALHVAITHRFALDCGRPFVLDLYDNYASFGLIKLPGLEGAYRRAIAAADAISCVSDPLRTMVEREYGPRGELCTIESTINAELFKPHPRATSRVRLGLPADQYLIGTAGALDSSRGTGDLFRAYADLRASRSDIGLALAGRLHPTAPLPAVPGIHHLGELDHTEIPYFFSALDVGVICMRDSAFGRYAFPQKAYELIACRTPVVAADVGALRTLMTEQADSLYTPGDAGSLARCLSRRLAAPAVASIVPPTWADQAVRLDSLLQRAAGCA